MSKSKKILGILMAVVLLVTTMAPLFAHAVDLDELSQQILNLPTLSGANANREAQCALYDAVKADYLTLTEEQKDSLDYTVQRKMILLSGQVYKFRNTGCTNLQAHDGIIAWGIPTADMIAASEIAQMFFAVRDIPGHEGIKLGTSATAINFTVQENADAFLAALALYENSTDTVKDYFAEVLGTSGYLIDSVGTIYPLYQLLQVYGNYAFQKGLDPVATTALRGMIYAFANIKLSTNYTKIQKLALDMMPHLENFSSNATIDEATYAPVLAEYQSLSEYELVIISKFSATTVILVGATQTATNINNLMNNYFPGLYAAYGIIPLLDQLDEENLDNALLRQIKVYWDTIPAGGRAYLLPADYRNKYNRVNPLYVPLAKQELNTSLASTDAFNKSAVSYPPYGKTRTELAFCTLDPLVQMIKDLAIGDIGELLYTNQLASSIVGIMATFEVPAMASMIGIDLKPSAVAGQLAEPGYAAAKAYFSSLGSSWDNYDASKVDWGFEDGDREAFVNAVAAGLRRLTSIIVKYGFVADQPNAFNDYVTKNPYNDYLYGKYETMIVPALEALGCPGVVQTDEVNAQLTGNIMRDGDVVVKALLHPIFNLVEDIMTNPLPKILDLLPNVAYGVANGAFDELFAWDIYIAMGNHVKVVPANSMDELLNMIVGGTGLVLPELDWAYLAGLGQIKNNAPSASNRNANTTYIVADRADVFTYLVRYLGSMFQNETNIGVVFDLLTNALGVSVKYADWTAFTTACKSGNVIDAGKALIELGKKIFANLGGDPSEIPSEPTDPVEPTEPSTPGMSFGDFFARFFEFIKQAFMNYVEYFRNIFR